MTTRTCRKPARPGRPHDLKRKRPPSDGRPLRNSDIRTLVNLSEVASVAIADIGISYNADLEQAEQVVRNYVSNAFNHLDGDRVVDVKIHAAGDKVRVTVFNTGQPIPEEDLPHIWEKFYKVDKAHTREYGGNGIGLSIVRAIMESFHQQYGVKNYDNGVEFWFELDVR